MMSNKDLPWEVTLMIIKSALDHEPGLPSDNNKLPSSKDKVNLKCLANLSLVCKAFHTLVEPVMYQTYVKPDSLESGTNTTIPNMALRRYLCTLLERPDLARRVTKVVYGSWQTLTPSKHSGIREKLQPPDERLLQLYDKAPPQLLDQIDLYRHFESREHVLRDNELAEVCLLLLLLSNVKELHLLRGLPGRIYNWPHNKVSSHFKVSKLSSLKEVFLGGPAWTKMGYGSIVSLLKLPSVDTVHLNRIDLGEDWSQEFGLNPPEFEIRHIYIRNCEFPVHLHGGPGLQSLNGLFSDQCMGWQAWFSHLRDLQQSQQQSLEYLSLDGPVWRRFTGPSSSFRNFKVLKHLHVQCYLLLGNPSHVHRVRDLAELLPLSLEHFSVSQCIPEIVEMLESLVFGATCPPKLKFITLGPFDLITEDVPDRVYQLKKSCAAMGIEFTPRSPDGSEILEPRPNEQEDDRVLEEVGDRDYGIDRIVARQYSSRDFVSKKQYLVRWKVHGPGKDQWFWEDMLPDAGRLVGDFRRRMGKYES